MSIMPPGKGKRRAAQAVAADFERALSEHRGGRKAAAEAGYRAVLRQAPHHLGALQNLGVICRASGRCDEALALYRRALAQEPGADAVRERCADNTTLGDVANCSATAREPGKKEPGCDGQAACLYEVANFVCG